MDIDSVFSLPELSKWHKNKFLGYAMQVLESQQTMMSKKGKNILHYTLEKKRRHQRFNHYPKGDRIDKTTGAQYFYHCHRENLESSEHGHFHCFLRYKHIPKSIKPTALPDWDKYIDNPMAHVIAVGMNRLGMPIRLFTVNRWVTSEIWYDAKHAPNFVKRFKMQGTVDPYWKILDQWVEGILQIFAPQIAWLHQERDKKIAIYQSENPDKNPYLDLKLEELSDINIDLQKQIEWIIS